MTGKSENPAAPLEDTARTSLKALARGLEDIRDNPGVPPADFFCDPGLWPILEALKATLDVFGAFPDIFGPKGGTGLTRPLHDLLMALLDLKDGHTHPLLRTIDTKKRGSSAHYQVTTSTAAIALDALIRTGSNRHEAAGIVAAKLRAVDQSEGDHRKAVTAKTVQNWRYELSAGKGMPYARMAWENYTKVRPAFSNRPNDLAAAAMDRLHELVQKSAFRISP